MAQYQSFVLIPEDRLNEIHEDISSIRELLTNKKPEKEIGGIQLAVDTTGLTAGTIYQQVHKKEIPFIKRGGRLYFERSKLIAWIKEGQKGGEAA